MERYIVNGARRLSGEMKVHGAKNAALPILAASLLCDGCELHNCPHLSDVDAACNILKHLGCSTRWQDDVLLVEKGESRDCTIPTSLMHEMRSSIVFLGAMLAKYKKARLAFPGGCELGPRPIDLHLSSLQKMGVEFEEEQGALSCRVCGQLHGAQIDLPFPSVGATENILLAASLAKGQTVIHNAAREPEIGDLVGFLQSCGAKIRIGIDGTIFIEGVSHLHESVYHVIPDRIVTITYLCCAAITGGDILVHKACPEHIRSVVPILEEMGCRLTLGRDGIRLSSSGELHAVRSITTMPYPGFPTDALAPIMALSCVAEGTTVFTETIFQNRYKQAWELCRMGADIKTEGRIAVVRGRRELHPAHVSCTDLRGGAALVIAALGTRGVTTIEEIRHITRGYEELHKSLNRVGADICCQ